MYFQTDVTAFSPGGSVSSDELERSIEERISSDPELESAVKSWLSLSVTGKMETPEAEILFRLTPGGANLKVPADVDTDLTRFGAIKLVEMHQMPRAATRVAIPGYSTGGEDSKQLFGPAFIDPNNRENVPALINYCISIGAKGNHIWDDAEFAKIERHWFSDRKTEYFDVERGEECRSRFFANRKIVMGGVQLIPVFTVVDPENPQAALEAHSYDLLRAFYHHKPKEILGHIAFPPEILSGISTGLPLTVIQSLVFVKPESSDCDIPEEIIPKIGGELLARRAEVEGVHAKNSLDHQAGDQIKNGKEVLGYPLLNTEGTGWVAIVSHDMPIIPGALSKKWSTEPEVAEQEEIEMFLNGEGVTSLGAPQQRPWWNALTKIQEATVTSPLEINTKIPFLCPIFTKMSPFGASNIVNSICIELYAHVVGYTDPFRMKLETSLPHPELRSITQDIHVGRNKKSYDLELPWASWDHGKTFERRQPMTDSLGRGFTEVEAIYSMHDIDKTQMVFHFASRLARLSIECPKMEVTMIFPMLILNQYNVDGLDNPDTARRMMNVWLKDTSGREQPSCYLASATRHEVDINMLYTRDEDGFITIPADTVTHPLDASLNEFYDATYRSQSECTIPVQAGSSNFYMAALRRFFIDDSSQLDTRSVRRMDSIYMVNFFNRFDGVNGPKMDLAQPEVFTSWQNNVRYARPHDISLSSPHDGFDNYYLLSVKKT